MTLGGANVWSNFSHGYSSKSTSGWILNPARSRLILFTRNNKSNTSDFRNLAHSYYANGLGEHSAIKSSSQIHLDNAWDKWHDQQLEGWTFEELELTESA